MPKHKDSWLSSLLRSPKKKGLPKYNLHNMSHALSSGENPNLNKIFPPSKKNSSLCTWSPKVSFAPLPASASVSRYATIGRKKPSQVYQQLCDYYSNLCIGTSDDDNASVCSLPLPPREISSIYDQLNRGGSLSGMIQFRSYASSYSDMVRYKTSNFSSVAEENPFAFLDDYDIQPESQDELNQYYFLPRPAKNKALEKWRLLESSGDYNKFMPVYDDAGELKRKPLCLTNMNVVTAVKSKATAPVGSDASPYFY